MSTPVTTSWTTISGSAGSFDAYLALPPAGRGPGLLLLQEIFGVNEHIRTVAEQYALDGFVVLAPDVFWQQQRRLDIGYTPDDIQRGRALAMAADRPRCSATWPTRCKRCARGPRCRAAASAPSATAWAGGWPTWPRPRPASMPRWPTTAAASRTCSTWRRRSAARCSSTTARSTPTSRRRRWTRCVRRCRASRPRCIVYDGADHGFNCWARGSYHAASAALAHGRTLQFLATKLF